MELRAGGTFRDWLQQTVTSSLTDFLSSLANDLGDAIVGFINQVNFLMRTPENVTYRNDLVKQYATASQVPGRQIARGGGPYQRLQRHSVAVSGRDDAAAPEVLPRVVLAAIRCPFEPRLGARKPRRQTSGGAVGDHS
jgi:hypothetical protein